MYLYTSMSYVYILYTVQYVLGATSTSSYSIDCTVFVHCTLCNMIPKESIEAGQKYHISVYMRNNKIFNNFKRSPPPTRGPCSTSVVAGQWGNVQCLAWSGALAPKINLGTRMNFLN